MLGRGELNVSFAFLSLPRNRDKRAEIPAITASPKQNVAAPVAGEGVHVYETTFVCQTARAPATH